METSNTPTTIDYAATRAKIQVLIIYSSPNSFIYFFGHVIAICAISVIAGIFQAQGEQDCLQLML